VGPVPDKRRSRLTKLTLTDERMLNQLTGGREALLSDASSRPLLSALYAGLQRSTRNLFIISWTPEQVEDLYDVLVDGRTIGRIEVSRDAERRVVAFDQWPVDQYMRKQRLDKLTRRKLLMALELARSPESESLKG
jgi:hypothetical protein